VYAPERNKALKDRLSLAEEEAKNSSILKNNGKYAI
jgi:hypothetical protein